LRAADLVLCIGYDPIEMRPGWRNIWDVHSQNVIDIAPEPNLHYMHQAGLNFLTTIAPTLAALSSDVTPRTTWTEKQPHEARTALAQAFPVTDDWGPAAVISETRKVMPENTLASADSGAHRILLSQMWQCHEPRGLIQSSALCTMGCAIPMAIGRKLAQPGRPVISFSGDAGFLMVAGELATAAEMQIAPIFLVFVDASLALIELKQRQRHLPNAGVDFARHDFAAMGRAFSGNGVTVRNRKELRAALTAAMTAQSFTVIAAEIEPGGYDGRI